MAIFKKERKYPSQQDISQIVNDFVQYLQNNGFKVQQKVEGDKAVVQAQKAGILRDLVAADRALTFTFENTPEYLKVNAGIGKWIQNLGVTAVEALIVSPLFLAVDVPEILWTEHVESDLMKHLDSIVKGA